MTSSPFGEIMQFGYIVKDVEAGIKVWSERIGAGPFYLIERLPMEYYFYRGEQRHPEIKVAFGYWGDIQIELISPVNDELSLYSEALKTGEGKLNHCATVVSDLDDLLKSRNLGAENIIQKGGQAPNTRFVYLNEYLPGGLHLELIEAPQAAHQGWAGMKAMHKAWKGERPIRSMFEDLGPDLQALAKR